jgi:hypothetical protein
VALPFDCYICGLARDCAASLKGTLASIESLSCCFQRVDLVVVTNDSVDATSEILIDWAATRAWATVFNADGLAPTMIGRSDRMSVLRNFCLFELRRRTESGRHFDLMIVLDFDGVNENLSLRNDFCDLISNAPNDWGGIFANQRQGYYDVWALRHPKWCAEDCWHQVSRSTRGFVPPLFRRRLWVAAYNRYVGRRQVKIEPQHAPIEVDSAFGGFGVYKTSSLGDAWYCGRDGSGREVCEHVAFNFGVRRSGAKLYVMPALLNDAPVEHLAPGSGAAERPWE